jgi:hypothetical protein
MGSAIDGLAASTRRLVSAVTDNFAIPSPLGQVKDVTERILHPHVESSSRRMGSAMASSS